MNILFLTTRLFDTPRSGGEVCSARLLQALRCAGHRVQVIGRGPALLPDQRSLGPLVPAFDTLPRLRQAAALAAAWQARQALTVQRLAAGDAPAQMQRWFDTMPLPDALWLDHLQVLPWLARVRRPLPAPVLVMHNMEADGYAEQAEQAAQSRQRWRRRVLHREAQLLRQLEDIALARSSAVACLSDDDAGLLRRRTAAPVVVLPGYPLQALQPLDGPPATRTTHGTQRQQHRIGLLGTWTWGPNRAALQWMLDSVLPHLPSHCRLVLAGTGLDGLALPPRVGVLGRVDDVAQFYDQIDTVALPSLQGSGVQEKAIEALASGRSIVATPHAMRGLGAAWPAHVRLAESPADFAAACAMPGAAVDNAAVQAWAAERRSQYRNALARCLQAGK